MDPTGESRIGRRCRRVLWSCSVIVACGFLLWLLRGPLQLGHGVTLIDPALPCPKEKPRAPSRPNRLLYNRVPKCGSTTIINLLLKLARSNGFVHIHSRTFNQRVLLPGQQAELAEVISETPAPSSYDRHVYFINFEEFGYPSPAYVNVIRDPVDRMVSSYYYRRVAAATATGPGRPSKFWLTKSFDECVRRGDLECTFPKGATHRSLTMPYFCGHDPRCRTVGNLWALHTARDNIERRFVVVGVLEDMNATLTLLQDRLPRFFGGAVALYHQLKPHLNQNHHRKPVSPEVKDMLRRNLSTEYELYRFVKQRLHSQLWKITDRFAG